jgi:CMP-N,N'-diacetyllegionaminic acid synthase
MKILGVIPARGGSKGIPRKNIRLLAGKPLIQYSIDEALKSPLITELIVSTDDHEIAEIAGRLGASIPFLRPEDLGGDKIPTIDVLVHLTDTLRSEGKEYDALCLLQPTTPLRTVDDIQRAIEIFQTTECDSLISVLPVPHELNPHWTFVVAEDRYLRIATGEKEIIPRRQELPKAYYRNGAIYITKMEIIQRRRSLYGDKIAYFEMNPERHVNIDTMDDWNKAESFFGRNE